MEVKIFIYDKNLRPENFSKLTGLNSFYYEPCFAYGKLYKKHNISLFLPQDIKGGKMFLTFGTLYTIENVDKLTIDKLDMLFLANNHNIKTKIKIKTIKFHNISSFLEKKFEIQETLKVHAYVCDLSKSFVKNTTKERHRWFGNFHKEFLNTYRCGNVS